MKVRSGFVTNSSSSSFICVLGKVIDKEKFLASGLGKCYYGWQLKNDNRIIDEDWHNPFYELGAGWAGVWIDDSYLIDEQEYFYWEAYGGAGDNDYCFQNDSDDYDLNYDVSLADFPEDQQLMYGCAIEENGLKYIDSGYGAIRGMDEISQ